MDILKNKSYKNYNRLSRYQQFPTYYNTLDNKYMYGTTSYLNTNTPYIRYKVKDNDTYDSIALDAYNNPTYFWVICDFNKIQNPLDIPKPDTILNIPVLSNISFNLYNEDSYYG